MPFELKSQTDYLLIELKGDCVGDEKPSIMDAFKAELEKGAFKRVIFQCNSCGHISTPFMREMARIFKELKTLNGELRLVGANPQVVESIKRNGLDRILVNRLSLRGALVDFGLVKAKEFDVNFINPFLNATQKVFKVQCFTETKPSKPYLKKSTDPMLLGDISGIISISSETFNGTLAVSLSEPIFASVATKMLGEKIEAIKEDNVDLIGELANMILGQAKIELSSLGYSIQMALPSCVWGKDHKIKHFGGGICVVIPFETEFGTFYSEIMTNNAVAQATAKKTA